MNSKDKIVLPPNFILPSQQLGQLNEKVAKEYLHFLVKNMHDAFIIIDKNLSIILMNDMAITMARDFLNLPIQIGMSILDFASPERYETLKILYQSVFKGSSFETESNFKVSGKDKFYIQTSHTIDHSEQIAALEKELEYLKGFLLSVEKKLSNERFMQNAKPEIVDAEKKKKADAEEKIRAIEESLASLA